ncbi:hypothetical protein GJAV_G00220130 [Gymnothorax javanicus]|nr:hypothetical protein GJAV_G00220130 [Gymnothorax javanicus]
MTHKHAQQRGIGTKRLCSSCTAQPHDPFVKNGYLLTDVSAYRECTESHLDRILNIVLEAPASTLSLEPSKSHGLKAG